jgi:hypothetical protein
MKQFCLCLVFLFGCGKTDESRVQYRDGRQLLTLNETDESGQKVTRPTVQMIGPDSISIGEEYLTKIFLTDSDEDFIGAFTDCNLTDSLSIDTTTFKIDACRSKLFSQDDTVLLAFRPQTLGVKTFQPIKIVTRDKHGVFRMLDYTFDYKVVDN